MMNGDPLPATGTSENAWLVSQYCAAEDNFPFFVEATEVQLCIDYSAAHRRCCWARAMLRPIWTTFLRYLNKLNLTSTPNKEFAEVRMQDSAFPLVSSLHEALLHTSAGLRRLSKRFANERPPGGSVCRTRYVHSAPSVICMGAGTSGTLTLTFSLRRQEEDTMDTLFPSFIAVGPDETTASLFPVTLMDQRRSHTTGIVLLPLQHISEDRKTALYGALEADLQVRTSVAATNESIAESWVFYIYAAFYDSKADQIQSNEPFLQLHDWRSYITRDERFAVVNPEMDRDVVFAMAKRNGQNFERRLKGAVQQLDGVAPAKRAPKPPTVTLRHVATLRTTQVVEMEWCERRGGVTLATLLPKDTHWPLELRLGKSESGGTCRTLSIPGSASLERLARELEVLEGNMDCDHQKGIKQ